MSVDRVVSDPALGGVGCAAVLALVFSRCRSRCSRRCAQWTPPLRPLGGLSMREIAKRCCLSSSAVDLAQAVDGTSEAGLSWDSHVLKSGDHTAYVPFRVTMDGAADTSRPTAMYLRAVSRRDGVRASEERSFVRDWLLHGRAMPRNGETVLVGPGELPVGGPGIGSSRRGVADAAQASAVLSLQEREYEKQKRAD